MRLQKKDTYFNKTFPGASDIFEVENKISNDIIDQKLKIINKNDTKLYGEMVNIATNELLKKNIRSIDNKYRKAIATSLVYYIQALDTKTNEFGVKYIDTDSSRIIAKNMAEKFSNHNVIIGLRANLINKALNEVVKYPTDLKQKIDKYDSLNSQEIEAHASKFNKSYDRDDINVKRQLINDNKKLSDKAKDLEYKINKLK